MAYAAIMGKMFGVSKERGVYRTKDGGKTWQQVLSKNDSTGAIDIDFDPANPNTEDDDYGVKNSVIIVEKTPGQRDSP